MHKTNFEVKPGCLIKCMNIPIRPRMYSRRFAHSGYRRSRYTKIKPHPDQGFRCVIASIGAGGRCIQAKCFAERAIRFGAMCKARHKTRHAVPSGVDRKRW